MFEDEITTGEAARRLGCSPGTIHNWIDDGRIAARRGNQPERRRFYVRVDAEGWPLDLAGERVPTKDGSTEDRADAMQPAVPESLREVADGLRRVVHRSRQVMNSQDDLAETHREVLAEQVSILEHLEGTLGRDVSAD